MVPETWTAEKIFGLAGAYWASCALHAAVQTGVADALAKGPVSADELAGRLKLDRRGVGLLLTALAGLGLLQIQSGQYNLVPEAAPLLAADGPQSMGNAVLHLADMVADWSGLAQCVKSGQPARRRARAEGDGAPDPEAAHFYRAMRDIARRQASGLAARLGLKPGQRLLDLGGGPGVYGHTFAEEIPGLRVFVFDLDQAKEFFHEEGARHNPAVPPRFLAGDFRSDPLGGPYDVVWISQVLHGSGPDTCAALIKAAAHALAPGGALWVQEFVVDPAGKSNPFPALFSLNMLVNTESGQAYTAQEIGLFMTQAGLEQMEYVGPTVEGGTAALMRARKPA
jgi:ubiquinone/menaquinone biosynthesis C-methylase UbiE